ncbi:hypothetical protein EXIGLDRAFT_728413 [Exidia glandulosa HHB12029]|uniref:Mid2 domain-containing protein n=1 Tax=Exidia glandulosa HHB12029 TaxID=1314781 RepID=A0A165CY10_EXIGL|nr:hypothetical protein EXIGLDRAFT_728413 [Exidia glandulosa HHB12029]
MLCFSRILLAAATVRATIHVVLYNDARIVYTGTGWHDDVFEVREGIDPFPATAANDSSCELGDKSTSSGDVGAKFSFDFNGVGVALIMESRDDHGFFEVDLNGVVSIISGYSVAPHCGGIFVQQQLPLADYTISGTFKGRNNASKYQNSYYQLFAIRFDDGVGAVPTTTPPPSSSSSPTSTSSPFSPFSPSSITSSESSGAKPPSRTPKAHSDTGAIVGGVLGGIIAGFLIAFLIMFLVLRHRRSKQRETGYLPQHQNYAGPWSPGPVETGQYFAHPEPEVTSVHSSLPVSADRGRAAGIHDGDVERIAGRIAQLVQVQGLHPQGSTSVIATQAMSRHTDASSSSAPGPSSPRSPPPGAAAPQPPSAKGTYMSAPEDTQPPAYDKS